MYEVVSNSRNSVDVDKFDYLARDCYCCGLKSTYDFTRSGAMCRKTKAHTFGQSLHRSLSRFVA